VPLANLKVIEIMGRGDLHRTTALFWIGIVVSNDGDSASNQRQDGVLANQVAVCPLP